MPRQSASDKVQLKLKNAWTSPAGTRVIVKDDRGKESVRETAGMPWMLGAVESKDYPGHTAMISIEGLGPYCLDRIRLA